MLDAGCCAHAEPAERGLSGGTRGGDRWLDKSSLRGMPCGGRFGQTRRVIRRGGVGSPRSVLPLTEEVMRLRLAIGAAGVATVLATICTTVATLAVTDAS